MSSILTSLSYFLNESSLVMLCGRDSLICSSKLDEIFLVNSPRNCSIVLVDSQLFYLSAASTSLNSSSTFECNYCCYANS